MGENVLLGFYLEIEQDKYIQVYDKKSEKCVKVYQCGDRFNFVGKQVVEQQGDVVGKQNGIIWCFMCGMDVSEEGG